MSKDLVTNLVGRDVVYDEGLNEVVAAWLEKGDAGDIDVMLLIAPKEGGQPLVVEAFRVVICPWNKE